MEIEVETEIETEIEVEMDLSYIVALEIEINKHYKLEKQLTLITTPTSADFRQSNEIVIIIILRGVTPPDFRGAPPAITCR